MSALLFFLISLKNLVDRPEQAPICTILSLVVVDILYGKWARLLSNNLDIWISAVGIRGSNRIATGARNGIKSLFGHIPSIKIHEFL